jgi:TRAP-type C4-dicarboxylate transport system substrate-binding protein
LCGAHPVTVEAADLRQALGTGLINAFMTSSATGYDSRAWEYMTYFTTRERRSRRTSPSSTRRCSIAWINRQKVAMINAAAAAEARGWSASEEMNRWYIEQLTENGLKVVPPGDGLMAGLKQVGEAAYCRVAAQGGR